MTSVKRLHWSPAVWLTDDNHATILYASTAVRRLFDRPLGAKPRATLLASVHPDDRDRVLGALDKLPDGQYETSYRVQTADGYRRVQDRTVPMVDANGGVARVCRVLMEVEEVAADQPFEALLSNFPDMAFVIDRDGRYLEYLAGPTVEPLLIDDPESFIGSTLADVLPAAVADEIFATIQRALDRGEPQSVEYALSVPAGRRWFEGRLVPTSLDAVVFVARDVTERVERERELSFRKSILEAQQAAMPAGVLVLDDDDTVVAANDRLRKLWGLPADLDDPAVVAAIDDRSPRRMNPDPRGPRQDELVLDDGRVIERHYAPVASPDGEELGQLWTFRDVTRDRRREQTLRRQRDELATLERLNATIRSIGRSIVQAETRAEIEADVCDRFAGSEGFHAAALVEYDTDEHVVTVRQASHGIEVAADNPEAPLARAARSGEVQTVPDTASAPDGIEVPDEWTSYVVVPISYHGFVYGLLVVFPTFAVSRDDDMDEVLAELGEMVAHAINAAERIRLLDADECLEVTYRSAMLGKPFVNVVDIDTQAIVERVVPVGDTVHALYVRVTGANPDQLARSIANVPTVTAVREVGTDGDQVTFEVRLEGDTIPGVVTAAGGYIHEMRLVGEDFRFTVLLPQEQRVRQLTDRLQALDPTCRLTAIRTTSMPTRGPSELRTSLEETLPPRQRTALELAYFGGYFEWPRQSTGEELAEQLDVSPSTFHYHLRHAQRRLLEITFNR